MIWIPWLPEPVGRGDMLALVLVVACAACSPAAAQSPIDAQASTPGGQDADPASAQAADGVTDSSAGMRLDISRNGSEARFRAQEVLAEIRLPSEAVGRSPAVTGTIVLDGSGRVVPEESRLTVDLRQLRSDSSTRDRFIQQNTLQTNRFPMAEFVPQDVQGLAWPPASTADVTFSMTGDLTVHGVARPTTWQGTAHVGGGQVNGTASTRVNITDFGMNLPRVPLVLSLEDAVTLEVDLRGTLDGTR